jgi:3-deoxy-D-manno-octulosonic-acid transferase
MLYRLYNALWYPAVPFALLFGGGRDTQMRRERLGRSSVTNYSHASAALPIWVHAASVGEIEAVRSILLAIMGTFADAAIVLTTMTAAAREAAPRRIPGLAGCQLAPLDCPSSVRAFLERLRPRIVLITETELWPNFFIESARSGAKVAIINGRISERSMRRYRFIRPLLAKTLQNAELILAQTEDDQRRYVELGARASRVFVTGNTKFDFDETAQPLRRPLTDFAKGRPILVAGSTAPGEERMVLNAYRNLVERFPLLALVIAPRHLERTAEVEEELREAGLPYARARVFPSIAPADTEALTAIHEGILLLDTMGDLRGLYRRAAIAFVGGSMTPARGGQSLAEPAAVSVPVLFGPHFANQRQIGEALIEQGGGRIVNDAAQLESACAEWLADDAERRRAGERARQVMGQLGGGVAATLQHLKALLA